MIYWHVQWFLWSLKIILFIHMYITYSFLALFFFYVELRIKGYSIKVFSIKSGQIIITRSRVIEFNTTFNNISVITWQSDLLVEETEVHGENQWPATSHWQTLSHNVVSSTPLLSGIWTHNISGNRHWFIGSCKSYYHTIMTTTAHHREEHRDYL